MGPPAAVENYPDTWAPSQTNKGVKYTRGHLRDQPRKRTVACRVLHKPTEF